MSITLQKTNNWSPGDVVVPQLEGADHVEVTELAAFERVAQLVVVEVDEQQRVHHRPRLTT